MWATVYYSKQLLVFFWFFLNFKNMFLFYKFHVPVFIEELNKFCTFTSLTLS